MEAMHGYTIRMGMQRTMQDPPNETYYITGESMPFFYAVGNLHVFKGPGDFNGYGRCPVRLYWTGFGLPPNILGEYRALLTSQALTVRWCLAAPQEGAGTDRPREGAGLDRPPAGGPPV